MITYDTSSKDCDLSDRKAVYAFVDRIKKEHQIDILVNNAGTILRKPAAAYIHGAIIPVDGGWLAR